MEDNLRTNFNTVKNICVSANKFVLLRRNKAHARLKHFFNQLIY